VRGVLDLVVVGGGPAGLATAIAARLAGLSVRVLERARPPIDKACGEGLMPDAVGLLAALGVELPAESCHRFRGIRYMDGELTANGLFPQAGGLGVRRPVLHQALARRAAELGAELCWGAAVVGLAPAGPTPAAGQAPRRLGWPRPGDVSGPLPTGAQAGRGSGDLGSRAVRGVMMADGEVIEARWVAGADGLRSRVRRWAGLEGAPARHRRFGVRRHYACQPWNDLVEVHWGPGCEAYVTPVGPEEVGVALLWEDDAAPVAARGRARGGARAGGAADAADVAAWSGAADAAAWADTADAVGRVGAGAWAGAAGGAGGAAAGRVSFDALLAHFPALAERLAGAPVTSRDRGAGPLAQRPRRVWRANVALVGDAAGYLDAITGEGLAVALHQAVALAEALAGALAKTPEALAQTTVETLARTPPAALARPGEALTGPVANASAEALAQAPTAAPGAAGDSSPDALASYGTACRRIGRLPDIMTAVVLALERRPWLRRRAFSALAAEPALFSRLLGIHARTLPPAGLGIDGALRLVYRLVTA
jgi:flavin-dependent dehydrogenase